MTRVIPLLTVLLLVAVARAQETPAAETLPPVNADERESVVENIARLLNDRYIFPDVAKTAGEHLAGQLEAGEFDAIDDPEAFADRLTESLQSVTRDKHIRVRVQLPARAAMEREHPARARARQLERMRQENFGFQTVQRLDGNVGYLDMRYFAGNPEARATATAAMNFLGNADAIIFDMRQNGGGSPEMIRYITSWLFDEPTHLNSLYWREGDRTEEFWTLADVPGPRLADVPVFVLISGYTFSGAEEFSYNLRTRERATLIGATTGGGANPGGMIPASDRFRIFIPTGMAINPITGTNWEGTGVKPHIEMDAGDAYDVALEKAQAAAEQHREARAAESAAHWNAFMKAQAKAGRLADDDRHDRAAEIMTTAIGSAREAGLVGEMDINMLGYEQLMQDRVDLAIAIFKCNVDAYPESFNVYDSLGEAWMEKGDTEQATRWYRKSLELNPENENAEMMIRRMQED